MHHFEAAENATVAAAFDPDRAFTSSSSSPGAALEVNHAIGLAYDPIGNRVMWAATEPGKAGIMFSRVSTAGSSAPEYFIRDEERVAQPEDLAVDMLSGVLYFTEAKYKYVGAADLLSGARSVIIHESVDQPRGIALHPKKAFLFFTDWGNDQNGKVERFLRFFSAFSLLGGLLSVSSLFLFSLAFSLLSCSFSPLVLFLLSFFSSLLL